MAPAAAIHESEIVTTRTPLRVAPTKEQPAPDTATAKVLVEKSASATTKSQHFTPLIWRWRRVS
jgi:hypothetical protein